MKNIFILVFILGAFFSCKTDDSAGNTDVSQFDNAYPPMYSSLSLPEFRRGTLESVSGKTEGVKNVHTITILTDDSPVYVKNFIEPELLKLGWKSLNAGKRFADIAPDDLYFEAYVNGTNKYEINAATTPSGKTKIKIALAVFTKN